MLGLLTAISIGFNAVVLAQLVAPGPAAPGGRYPYGIGPGGIRMAPGAGGSTTTPLSVAPKAMSSAGGAERQREAFKGCAREASKDAEGEGAEVGKRFASARAG